MAKNLHETVCEEPVYQKIFKNHSDDLYKFLYYKFGSSLNPSDVVQEAFIKLWDNCKDVAPNKAKAFLFTVGKRMMLNELKHQKIVHEYALVKPNDINMEDPEFLLEESEYLQKYQNALSKLPEGQREAFLLNRIEGKRHKEIAEMLGISRKAVEKRIYTALNTLKEEIEGLR
jgi:RNA polymerase sigma-70 factor (ECF subfamily)